MDLFAPTHLLILLLIVLVIFGPSKLGDVGGALGKAVKDFKKAVNEPEGSNNAATSNQVASSTDAAQSAPPAADAKPVETKVGPQ